MKPCFSCNIEKPIDDFYKCASMKDGHLNKCKSCTRLDVKKNRENKKDYYLHYDRNRPNKQERAQCNAVYSKTEKGKEVKKVSQANYKSNYPLKRKAHTLVSNAIRDKKLERPNNCSSCQCLCVPHAHHCDYSKPLDVMWLCQSCHTEWHKQNKPIYPEMAA